MKRLLKWFLGIAAVSCLAFALAGCVNVVSYGQVQFVASEGVESITYTDPDEIDTAWSSGDVFDVQVGHTIDLNSENLEIKYYTGYVSCGWELTVDGVSKEVPEDGIITIDSHAKYVITALSELDPEIYHKNKIYLGAEGESIEGLTILTDYVEVYVNTQFSVDSLVEGVNYTLDEGYTISSWTLYEDSTTYPNTTSFGVQEDITYRLVPTVEVPATVTVTLEGSEGVSIKDEYKTCTVDRGGDFTLTDDMYELEDGYEFVEWDQYVDDVYWGPVISNDLTVTIEKPGYVFVAIAEKKETQTTTVTVQVSGDGISLAGDSQYEVTIGDDFELTDSLYTLSEGYELDGWTLSINGGDAEAVSGTVTIESDGYVFTATAKKTAYTLTIQTVLEDTTSTYTTQTIYIGDELTLSNLYTAETGQKVTAWEFQADGGSSETASGETYTIESAANYTLTIQLAYIEVTVTIQSTEHVSVTTDTITLKFGTYTIEEQFTVEAVDGYKITAWQYQIAGDGNTYTAANGQITIDTDAAYTLIPVVVDANLSLSVYVNGNLESTPSISLGDAFDLSSLSSYIDEYAAKGYTITGWVLTEEDSGDTGTSYETTGSIEFNTAGHYILTASVTPMAVSIALQDENGTALSTSTYETTTGATVTEDDLITAANYAKAGYEVTWTLTLDGSDVDLSSGSFTVEYSTGYVFKASVTPLAVSIDIQNPDGSSVGTYSTSTDAVVAISDLENAANALYSATGYDVTWTLTLNNESVELDSGSFTVQYSTGYVLKASLDAKAVTIEIQDESGSKIGTYETKTGAEVSISALEEAANYTVEGYTVTWTLTLDGSAVSVTDGSFTVEYSTGYVFKASIQGNEVIISIIGADSESLGSCTTAVGATVSLDEILTGINYSKEGYTVSWTLNDSEVTSDSEITIAADTTYTLKAVLTGNTVTIQINDENGDKIGEYETKVGDSPALADIIASITYTVPAYNHLTGWTLTVDDSEVSYDTTISITAEGTYVLTPILTPYATVTISAGDAEGISITADWTENEYSLETSYDLPNATDNYTITGNYELTSWILMSGEETVATYTVGSDTTFSITTAGAYTLVAVTVHYYTATAAEVENFSLETIKVYDGDTLTLPSSADSNPDGQTLESWYVETTDEVAVGDDNGIYALGGSITDVAEDLVIWPVYEETYYTLTPNSAHTYSSSSPVTDYSGTADSFGTGVSEYNSTFSTSTAYNKTDNVEEFTVSSTEHFYAGYWFRLNTNASETLVKDSYYDIFYALTNYSSTTLTINLYHCTNGLMAESGNNAPGNYVLRSVTLEPGETKYISIYDFLQDYSSTTYGDSNGNVTNFISLIQLESECTDFTLGVRIRVEEFTDSIAANVSIDSSAYDTTIFNFTDDANWLSTVFYEGTEYDVPTDDNYYLNEGYVIIGWYIYDDNGNELELVTNGKFTPTAGTVILTPYIVEASEATKSVTITDDVTGVSLKTDLTYSLADASVTLPGLDEVTNDTGRELTGWYVETSGGEIVGGGNGIYSLGDTLEGVEDDLVLWPVFTQTEYNLDANGNMSQDNGYATDESGYAVGSYDKSDNINSYFSSGTEYNKTDNVEEFTIYSSSALSSGSWFRLNTIATPSGLTFTSGHYYDISYAITNHGTEDITISVYHCTNGYMNGYPSPTDTNNYAEKLSIVIKAGETVYITFDAFYESVAPDGNNFITVIAVNVDVESLALGVRINVAETDLTIATPSYTYNEDTGVITITDDTNDESKVSGYEIGLFTSEDAEEAAFTVEVTSGEAISTGHATSGTYYVRVRAVGNDPYTDSAWTDDYFTITIEKEALAAPTFSYDASTDTITVSDSTNTATDVDYYVVGLFADGAETPSYTYNVDAGDTVMDYLGIAIEQYTIKVMTVTANDEKTDSEWSETTATIFSSLTTITNGLQATAYGDAGTWYEYHPTSSPATTVTQKLINNESGTIYVSFTNTGSTNEPLKLFYMDNNYSEGDLYTLSFTIVSNMEGYMLINGESVRILAGTNYVSVTRELPSSSGSNYNVVTITFGATVGSITYTMQGNFEIKDLTYYKVTQLATPTSFTYDSTEGLFTVTDETNGANAVGYAVGLYSGSTLKYTLTIAEDGTIDTSNVVEGDYTVEVKALGDGTTYVDSEFTSSTEDDQVTITVSGTGLISITGTGQSNADGKSEWYKYYESSKATENMLYVDTNSDDEDDIGTVYLDYTAQVTTSNEPFKLFYDDNTVTAGQTYTLTFTLYSEMDGYITVNEQTVEIHAGYNTITVTRELPSSGAVCIVTIAFGATLEDGSVTYVDGYFVLSDFSWEVVST